MIVIPNVTVVKPENCLECCAMGKVGISGGHGGGHWWEYECNLLGRMLSSYGAIKNNPPEDCPFMANNFSLIRRVIEEK